MRKSIWKIEKLIAMVVMTATCIILLLSVVLCAPLWLLSVIMGEETGKVVIRI